MLTRIANGNSTEWVDLSRIERICHFDNDENAAVYLRGGSTFFISVQGVLSLVASINGAAAAAPTSPAADVPPGTTRLIHRVDCYTSNSGNKTWKGYSQDNALVYFRQAHKGHIGDNAMWDMLEDMDIGETAAANILVRTIPDGDFHKPVEILMFTLDRLPPPVPTKDMSDPLYSVLRSGDFVILDTETTGLGSDAEICQVAIIDSQGKTLLDTLVKPVRAIPAEATRIHGITNDMVKAAPNFINVAQAVWDACQGKTVIVYNAEYDFRLLEQSEKACNPLALSDWHTIERECAMIKFAEIYGDWNDYKQSYRWQKLETAARHYGLPVVDAHSALGDCQMTLAVCKAMLAAEGDDD